MCRKKTKRKVIIPLSSKNNSFFCCCFYFVLSLPLSLSVAPPLSWCLVTFLSSQSWHIFLTGNFKDSISIPDWRVASLQMDPCSVRSFHNLYNNFVDQQQSQLSPWELISGHNLLDHRGLIRTTCKAVSLSQWASVSKQLLLTHRWHLAVYWIDRAGHGFLRGDKNNWVCTQWPPCCFVISA